MKDEIAMIITFNTEAALKFEERANWTEIIRLDDEKVLTTTEAEERCLMKIVVYCSLILIYVVATVFFCSCHVTRKEHISDVLFLSYEKSFSLERDIY